MNQEKHIYDRTDYSCVCEDVTYHHRIMFKKLSEKAIIPEYKTLGAAGMDVCSAEENYILKPQEIHIFKTGLSVEIPEGYEIQVRPRSGLACKHGITVVNSPGTIDSDYRGEIGVALINLSPNEYEVCLNDRIAQLVVNEVKRFEISMVDTLSETERGEGGFGSTGVN